MGCGRRYGYASPGLCLAGSLGDCVRDTGGYGRRRVGLDDFDQSNARTVGVNRSELNEEATALCSHAVSGRADGLFEGSNDLCFVGC